MIIFACALGENVQVNAARIPALPIDRILIQAISMSLPNTVYNLYKTNYHPLQDDQEFTKFRKIYIWYH